MDKSKMPGAVVAEGAAQWVVSRSRLVWPPLNQLIDSFLKSESESALSRLSQVRYRNELLLYGRFLEESGEPDPASGTTLCHYLRWRSALEGSDSSFDLPVASSILRIFFRYLQESGLVEGDPFDAILVPRVEPGQLLLAESRQPLAALERLPCDGWSGSRDRALLRLIAITPAGVSALLRVDLPAAGTRSLLTKEGLLRYSNRSRILHHLLIDRMTMEAVDQWLLERKLLVSGPENHALFISRTGARLSIEAFGSHIRILRRKYGDIIPAVNSPSLLKPQPAV